jgi:hypothetical protein
MARAVEPEDLAEEDLWATAAPLNKADLSMDVAILEAVREETAEKVLNKRVATG